MIEDVAFGVVLGVIILGVLGAIVWLIFALLGALHLVTTGSAHPRLEDRSLRWDGIILGVMLVALVLAYYAGAR